MSSAGCWVYFKEAPKTTVALRGQNATTCKKTKTYITQRFSKSSNIWFKVKRVWSMGVPPRVPEDSKDPDTSGYPQRFRVHDPTGQSQVHSTVSPPGIRHVPSHRNRCSDGLAFLFIFYFLYVKTTGADETGVIFIIDQSVRDVFDRYFIFHTCSVSTRQAASRDSKKINKYNKNIKIKWI